MNPTVTYGQSGLGHAPPPPTQTSTRSSLLEGFHFRQIARDVTMLLSLIAFVLTFAALRFTLFAPPDVVERVLIPAAAGAAVVCVLALLCSIALHYGDTTGSKQ